MLHLFGALYMISNELSNELRVTGPRVASLLQQGAPSNRYKLD